VPTDFCPTFFLKLFFPAYLLTQAKDLKGTASHDGNQNYSSSITAHMKSFWGPECPDQFEFDPHSRLCGWIVERPTE